MSAKRPNLAALANAAGSVRVSHEALQQPSSPSFEAELPKTARPKNNREVPPSRVGDKPITAFYPEEVRTQLKMLALEHRRSMESMIGEALNDLFAKYGKPEIVPLTKG